MFDVGFMELILIGVILLLVVGPERLPKLARFAGVWVGKAQKSFESVKDEVNKEIAAEELKKALEKQNSSDDLFDIVETTKKDIEDLGKQTSDAVGESKQAFNEIDKAEEPQTERKENGQS